MIYLAEQRENSLKETARNLGVSKHGYWLKTEDSLVGEYYAPGKDREEGLRIVEGAPIPVQEF